MSDRLKQRKFGWPDDAEALRELDDATLLKFWRYAPRTKTLHECHCSFVLCDELVNRGLK